MNAKKGKTYPSNGQAFLERLRDDFDQAFKEQDLRLRNYMMLLTLKLAEETFPNHEITLQMRSDYNFEFND